jgi:hypothetical protein
VVVWLLAGYCLAKRTGLILVFVWQEASGRLLSCQEHWFALRLSVLLTFCLTTPRNELGIYSVEGTDSLTSAHAFMLWYSKKHSCCIQNTVSRPDKGNAHKE